MKKTLLKAAIIFVVVLIVCAVVGVLYIGTIAKMAIEQIGPKVTQVSVKVDAVDVGILTGSASLKGLVVGNPQGFSTTEAIKVGNVAINLAPMSALSQKIVIHSIDVESPEITFEGGLLGSNNLSKLMDNVNSSGKNNNPSNNNSSTNAVNGKPAPKIEVDDFVIKNGKVHVHLTNIASQDIPLPDIHLTDLGKGTDGMTPAELSTAILKSLTTATLKAVATSAGQITQGLTGLGKDAGNAVSNSAKNVVSTIGGVFGK